MEMESILDGLFDSIKAKAGSCSSENELWDKLQDLYANPKAEEVEASYNLEIQKEKNYEVESLCALEIHRKEI
jgi:hypothetical protein